MPLQLIQKVYFHGDTDLHGLVELVGRGEKVDVGARDPEGGYVLSHPSEVGAEAVCALSSGRPGGPGDTSGGRVGLSQEGSQQQHGGPAGKRGTCFCVGSAEHLQFSKQIIIKNQQNLVLRVKSFVSYYP